MDDPVLIESRRTDLVIQRKRCRDTIHRCNTALAKMKKQDPGRKEALRVFHEMEMELARIKFQLGLLPSKTTLKPLRQYETRVTDHAVVRFLERVHGIDVERIKRHMQRIVDKHPHTVYAGTHRIDDFVYVIGETGLLVTVYAQNETPEENVGETQESQGSLYG